MTHRDRRSLVLGGGFTVEAAQIAHRAIGATRRAGLADMAPEQDQPMMGVLQILLRNDLIELVLDLIGRLAGGQAGAVGNPKNMGVDGDGGLAEHGVENDAGGFAPDSGQRLQGRTIARHLSAMALDQQFAQGDDVFGLGVVEADGADVRLEPGFAQGYHFTRCIGGGEKRFRRPVDALIGDLRGQHDGDQSGERIFEFELRLRRRDTLRQPFHELRRIALFHGG